LLCRGIGLMSLLNEGDRFGVVVCLFELRSLKSVNPLLLRCVTVVVVADLANYGFSELVSSLAYRFYYNKNEKRKKNLLHYPPPPFPLHYSLIVLDYTFCVEKTVFLLN
jgi:hypothetical protein